MNTDKVLVHFGYNLDTDDNDSIVSASIAQLWSSLS